MTIKIRQNRKNLKYPVERAYDLVAGEYAETFAGEHGKKPKDQEILRGFAERIGRRKPVWDLGCGPGQTTGYLKGLGLEISGLDLSEKMLEQARLLHPEMDFIKGDILRLGFDDGSIAGIVAFYAMVHFTREQVHTALGEIFRVLSPGGLFLSTHHVGDETIRVREFLGKKVCVDFMLFPADFICASLKEAGFTKIEIIERPPYPGVEYQSRRAYAFAEKPEDFSRSFQDFRHRSRARSSA